MFLHFKATEEIIKETNESTLTIFFYQTRNLQSKPAYNKKQTTNLDKISNKFDTIELTSLMYKEFMGG